MEFSTLSADIIKEEFKACPFCDEYPNVFQVPDDRNGGQPAWVVECKQMGCMFKRSSPNPSLENLTNDWNQRYGVRL